MSNRRLASFAKRLRHRLWVLLGGVSLTLAFFLVLPLMQAINQPPVANLMLQTVDTANIPPPPAPPEEEPEPEPEPEPPPPELTEQAPPLDLAQLEMALNPTLGDGWGAADFGTRLQTADGEAETIDAVFSMADLDQPPRVIYQPAPLLDKNLRKRTPATVYVVFVVNQRGGVEEPMAQKSTDPLFDKAAVAAVRQWKFEPGKRGGTPVRFRMRVPITFPKGNDQ